MCRLNIATTHVMKEQHSCRELGNSAEGNVNNRSGEQFKPLFLFRRLKKVNEKTGCGLYTGTYITDFLVHSDKQKTQLSGFTTCREITCTVCLQYRTSHRHFKTFLLRSWVEIFQIKNSSTWKVLKFSGVFVQIGLFTSQAKIPICWCSQGQLILLVLGRFQEFTLCEKAEHLYSKITKVLGLIQVLENVIHKCGESLNSLTFPIKTLW